MQLRERVGFIGLGAMGRPMAARPLQAGYPVSALARGVQAMESSPAAAGDDACTSPQDVANRGDIVFTVVTATTDVDQVVLGKDGVIQGAARGAMCVDMKTISPLATRRIAAALDVHGMTVAGVPVSGGRTGAQAGTLSIMMGAEPARARGQV